MKKRLLLLFFVGFVPCISQAQFLKFENGCYNGLNEAYKLEDILERKDTIGLEIIFHYDLLMSYDLLAQLTNLKNPPEFKNLECLGIKFAIDPQSSDSLKIEFIKKIKIFLTDLQFLFNSPNLKRIYFSVGEQIFLTKAEIKKYKYEKFAVINLKRAWESFGKEFQNEHHKIILYGENGNW